MSRRRTYRNNLPKIDLSGLKLPKMDLPQVDIPKPSLPKVSIPWRQIIVVIVMAVLVLTMMNLNTRLVDYYRLSHERDTLKEQVDGLKTTRMALQTQLAYVQSTPAVEEYARNAHMVREGEKMIIVLTPAGSVTTTQAEATPVLHIPQPWEIWWALFFGK